MMSQPRKMMITTKVEVGIGVNTYLVPPPKLQTKSRTGIEFNSENKCCPVKAFRPHISPKRNPLGCIKTQSDSK